MYGLNLKWMKKKIWKKNQKHTNKIVFEATRKKPVDVECTSFFNYAFSRFSVLMVSSFVLEMLNDIYIQDLTYTYPILLRINNTKFRFQHTSSWEHIEINKFILCVEQRFFTMELFASFSQFRLFPFVRSFVFSSFFSHLVRFPNSVITLSGIRVRACLRHRHCRRRWHCTDKSFHLYNILLLMSASF